MDQEPKDFLDDDNLIQIHPKVKKSHYELLQSINKDNMSQSLRFILDEYMKDKQQLYLDKFLTNFAIGMVIFGMGVVFQNIIIQLIMYAASAVVLGYSTYQYMKVKIRFNGRNKDG